MTAKRRDGDDSEVLTRAHFQHGQQRRHRAACKHWWLLLRVGRCGGSGRSVSVRLLVAYEANLRLSFLVDDVTWRPIFVPLTCECVLPCQSLHELRALHQLRWSEARSNEGGGGCGRGCGAGWVIGGIHSTKLELECGHHSGSDGRIVTVCTCRRVSAL